MARYLIIRVEDDSRRHDSGFARVRKTLHDLSREEGIALSDFGTDIGLVTETERLGIARIFERVMRRAKGLQKMIDEVPRNKTQWP